VIRLTESSEQEKIYNYLLKEGTSVKLTTISKNTSINYNTVRSAVNLLVEKRYLKRTERGYYMAIPKKDFQ
jgi:DNA-binding IclR family transcriptional regulator